MMKCIFQPYWGSMVVLLLVANLFVSCQTEKPKEEGSVYKLYFAGGQSNMEGFGFAKDLPPNYITSGKQVMIFNGNQAPDNNTEGGFGKWMPLSEGFGTGYKATKDTVVLSDRFGPELSFGKRIAELTNEKIAIIKYARGGSSIALGASGFGTWAKNYTDSTTINQWDHFTNTVTNAMQQKDIDGDGVADKLIPAGIIWMQGEADAYDKAASKVYLENITTLMKDISKVFSAETLPIVICKIEDSGSTPDTRMMKNIEPVWAAQKEFAAKNAHVEMISLSQPINFIEDKWHYESKHYLEMGERFAEKINQIKL